jgi:hypothetical protein
MVQDSVCACVQYKTHTCTLGLTTSAGDSRADEARRGGAVSPGGMSTLHLYHCPSPAQVPEKGGKRQKTCHGMFAPVPLPLACSHVSSNVSIRQKKGGGERKKPCHAYDRMATKRATARPTLEPTLVQRGANARATWCQRSCNVVPTHVQRAANARATWSAKKQWLQRGKRLQGKKNLEQSRGSTATAR